MDAWKREISQRFKFKKRFKEEILMLQRKISSCQSIMQYNTV